MSIEPHLYACVTRKPATSGSLSVFMIFTNAAVWLVSAPTMPMRTSGLFFASYRLLTESALRNASKVTPDDAGVNMILRDSPGMTARRLSSNSPGVFQTFAHT